MRPSESAPDTPRSPSPHRSRGDARLVSRRFLALLLAAAFLHLAVAGGIYLAASRRADNPLKLAARWLRSPDAYRYHYNAWKVHLFWSLDLNKSNPLGEFKVQRFTMLMVGVYSLLPSHPLVMIFLQALLQVPIGLLALVLARRLGQAPGRARLLALLVVLWPPSLIWSALPMKEPWALAAVLLFLVCLVALWREDSRRRTLVLASLGLPAALFFLVFLRFYFWKIMLVAAPLFLLGAWLVPRWQGRPPAWPRLAWAGLLLGLGLVLSLPYNHEFVYVFGTPAPPGRAPSYAPRPDPHNQAPQGLERVAPTVKETMLIRRRFEKFAGNSLPPDRLPSRWRGPWHLLRQLARGTRDLLFFPPPWQPWPRGQGWGILQVGLSLFSLGWYLLLPGLVLGGVRAFWHALPAGPVVVIWSLALGLALALVVLNLGTLFRLRDMAFLPLLMAWDPAAYTFWFRGGRG